MVCKNQEPPSAVIGVCQKEWLATFLTMSIASKLFQGLGRGVLMIFMAEDIIQYPADVRTNPVPVSALIALDAEQGTNERPGDGAITADVHGDRERRSGRLEVPFDLAVSVGDTWLIDGVIWYTQRQVAVDQGKHGSFQGWLISTTIGRRTQHPLLKDTRPIPRG